MGTSTDAHCYACGYDTSVLVGGFLPGPNRAPYCAWPVSCKVCSAITSANFEQSPLVCEACGCADVVPVTDPAMRKGGSKVVEGWGDLALTDAEYKCPRCGEFALRFGTNVGGHSHIMWD
jgi:hypothetical protein